MRFKNLTPYLFGYRPCARQPPALAMTAIVRAKYRIRPGQPLIPYRSQAVPEQTLQALAEEDAGGAEQLDRAMVLLGQGALTADRYQDDDHDCRGELLYPGDFAEFKLSADVMVRASCHLGREVAECSVHASVGDWAKELKVVGHRVWTDLVARTDSTEPRRFSQLAIDYAHAYGGPGFANNPVGKGHLDPTDTPTEDIYQPPRSARSQVLPSSQLPNILYADGSKTKRGLPAGLGPLSPRWAYRAELVGTEYGAGWQKTQAPFYASDFNWRHLSAAPPDQQMKGYLRGDEQVSFHNLHRRVRRLTFDLPKERIRVWILDQAGETREVSMNLDTLYADLDDDALYLTWRGLTPTQQDDLTDIEYGLIVSEPLDERRRPSAPYIEQLRAFARDPAGLEEALPAEVREAAAAADLVADGAIFEAAGETNPVSAALSHLGSVAKPTLDATRAGMATAFGGLAPTAVKGATGGAMRGGGAPSGPHAATAALLSFADQLDEAEDQVGPSPKLDDAREKIAAAVPEATADGLMLAGEDLSHQDLSGLDLRGANLSGALLDHADLSGANLAGANLNGCQLCETNLEGANLQGADLTMATLSRTKAAKASFAEAKLDMTQLNEVDAAGADFARVRGSMPTFTKCKLDDSQGKAAQLEQASFDEVSFERAGWPEAELRHARFRKCGMIEHNLAAAKLDGASFRECDLTRAKLCGAKGSEVALIDCTLAGADLSATRLVGALFQRVRGAGTSYKSGFFRDAQFDSSKMTGAVFAGANLRGAAFRKTGLDRAIFDGALLFEAIFNQSFGRGCNLKSADITRTVFDRSEFSK